MEVAARNGNGGLANERLHAAAAGEQSVEADEARFEERALRHSASFQWRYVPQRTAFTNVGFAA